MRVAFQVLTVIILSALLGLGLSILPASKTPTPFSECDTYPVGSAPSSCLPLGIILIILAIALLGLVGVYVALSRRHADKRQGTHQSSILSQTE